MMKTKRLRLSHLLVAGLFFACSVQACGAAEVGAGRPGVENVRFPTELGTVKQHFQGLDEGPLVVIVGESHVNLEVQQAVADALGYLRAAYGVRTVAFEGFQGGVLLPTPIVAGSLDARRASAHTDLLGRRINGVEYAALAYPDLRVAGVSKMNAYLRHGEELDRRRKERARQWAEDFQRFMLEEVARLHMSGAEAEELRKALEKLQKDEDLAAFIQTLGLVLEPYPEALAQLAELENRHRGDDDACSETRDDPLMAERDRWLTANTLRLADGSEPIALVVGRCHLEGVERELAAKNVSHVSFIVRGTDSTEFSAADAAVYDRWKKSEPGRFEAWLSKHKPGPQLARVSKRQHSTVQNALLYAASKLSEGASPSSVSAQLAAFGLPDDFLQETFFIKNGRGIGFRWKGENSFFYSSIQPFTAQKTPGYEIEPDALGGSQYLYAWGTGGGPPSGPISRTVGPAGGQPRRDPVLALIERRREKNPGAVTLELEQRDGLFHRRIDGGEWVPLLTATTAAVLEQVAVFRNADDPADGTLAAQRLAGMLLVDLDARDYENRRQLILVLDESLPLDLPLPLIAELGAEGPESFRTIRQVHSTRLLKPTNDMEESTAIATLEPILTQPPRAITLEETAVWIADDLRSRPEYDGLEKRLRQLGYQVGAAPTGRDTVVLLGDGSADWSVTLTDGRRMTAASLTPTEVEALLAINAEVEDGKVKQLRTFETATEESLNELEDLLKEIAERDGEPLDEILRQRTRDRMEREKAERHPALAAADPAFFERLVKSSAPTILSST